MSRRSFSEGGSLGEGGSFSQSGSKLGLTARRPLPYMPRVREMALFGPRDPVAGELSWLEHGNHNPGVGGSSPAPATIFPHTPLTWFGKAFSPNRAFSRPDISTVTPP